MDDTLPTLSYELKMLGKYSEVGYGYQMNRHSDDAQRCAHTIWIRGIVLDSSCEFGPAENEMSSAITHTEDKILTKTQQELISC